jgi:hypothetical protein
MIVLLVVATIALPGSVLLAWTLWLLFNCLIARWFGLAGLRATPPVAAAFRPREWAWLVRRPRPRS